MLISKLIQSTDDVVWIHCMPCLQLISCFIVQFVVRLSENVLKKCVIIIWLLLMKLKCTFKYGKSWIFNMFKKVDFNAICFSTCTFKKVAIIHCRAICLIHFQKKL